MWLPVPAVALIQRELLEGLREKKLFLLLLITNVLVLAVFGVGMVAVAENPSVMAEATSSAFKALCTMWYALAVLFIPAMAGASICIEKQQGSFDLLWTTLVWPSGVIAAKMINILSIFLLIVLSNLPVVGVMFFFVGVDWSEFLVGFGLVILTAVACAAAGLMCSAFFYRTLAAFAGSYAATLCFLGAPVGFSILMMDLLQLVDPDGSDWQKIACMCCPPIVLANALIRTIDGELLLGTVTYQVIFILVMLNLAWRFLKRPPRPIRVDSRKVIDDTEVLRARRHRFPFYLIDPQRRRAAIADRSNPMCAKEIYSGLLARPTWRVRAFYISFIPAFPLSLFAVAASFRHLGQELFLVCWGLAVLVVVLAPGVMAQALPKEYELGNMDLLRTTLLSPQQILLGKLFSAVLILAPFLLGALCGLSLMLASIAWDDPSGFLSAAVQGAVMISVNGAWALTLSLWASLYFRRTLPALIAGYITGLFFFAGIPLLFTLVAEFGLWPYGSMTREGIDAMIFLSSPLFASRSLFSPGQDTGLILWLIDMLFFATMSILLMGMSIRKFKRTHERDR